MKLIKINLLKSHALILQHTEYIYYLRIECPSAGEAG